VKSGFLLLTLSCVEKKWVVVMREESKERGILDWQELASFFFSVGLRVIMQEWGVVCVGTGFCLWRSKGMRGFPLWEIVQGGCGDEKERGLFFLLLIKSKVFLR